jgi:hypothetical protein
MTTTTFTADDLLGFLAIDHMDEDDADALISRDLRKMNSWLERGDGLAVYENHDLGHPALGHKVYLSFGSPAAQIESDDLPQFCPVNLPHGLMAWRYVLVGTLQGEGALDSVLQEA